MINAAKELARTAGAKPIVEANGAILAANQIVSGKFVQLANDSAGQIVVKPILGNVVSATSDILGIAADDTNRLPYNGLYEVIDNYFKNGTISSYVLGGMFTIWNDGRGAVFAADVAGVVPGTPLYIGSDGSLTKTAGSTATQVGAIVVGSVLRAPKSADGTLFFKAKGL